MDLSSTSRSGKKRLKVLIKVFIILVCIVICLLVLLYPFLGRLAKITGLVSGPYDHPNSIWVSDDPEIVLQVSSSRSVEESICYIVVDSTKIQVNFLAQPDRELVMIRPKDQTPSSSNFLIMGRLVYCTKDEIVFEVVEDNLFSGKYQEITMIRSEVNEADSP